MGNIDVWEENRHKVARTESHPGPQGKDKLGLTDKRRGCMAQLLLLLLSLALALSIWQAAWAQVDTTPEPQPVRIDRQVFMPVYLWQVPPMTACNSDMEVCP